MADKSSIVAEVREYLLEPDMSKPLNAIDTLRVHAGGDDGFFGKDDAETILEYLETLMQENDRIRRENEHFTKSGIIEVAVRNISVSDYMDHWEGRALAAESKLSALTLKDDPGNGADGEAERNFKLGDRVAKKSGSSWNGRIVGFYSTELTPIGYCVESERELGSVQIYPEAAIDFAPDPHDWHTDDEGDR